MAISVHPLRIFVSHSAKDNDFCVKLVNDLKRVLGENAQIWCDASNEEQGNKGDEGGSAWLPEFEAQVVAQDTHDVLLVLLSPDAVASTRVNNEIDQAWQRKNSSGGMQIIPVLYRPCDVRQDIDTLQVVSFLPPKAYDAAFAELLTAISTINSTPPAEVTMFTTLPSQIVKPKPHLSWSLAALCFVLGLAVGGGSIFWLIAPKSSNAEQVASIKLGEQPCPNTVKAPAHWAPLLGLVKGDENLVEHVSCGSLIGKSSLQTLVTVRLVGGTAAYQNLFVYDNIMAVKPLLLFSLFRLVQGDAKISNHNTIITSEVDPASSVNTGRPNADLVPDLYREFEWFDRENAFVQVSFPGFFPDLTRFQAETDQAKADRGQDPWKRDAKITAQHLAAKFYAWDANAPATLESGGGLHDIQAVVSVKNTGASGGTIKVMLSRLTGNANGGIWEVTAVESNGIAINSPESRRLLSNPVDVDVTVDSTLKGQKGALIILDHLYKAIGGASVSDLFSASLPQILFFSSLDGMGGSPHYPYAEEGVLTLVIGDASGKIIAATMQKELLGS